MRSGILNNEALARRAVACKGWRWLQGMKTERGGRNCGGREMRVWHYRTQFEQTVQTPDLTDPATLGCLLALVREVVGNPTISTREFLGEWFVGHDDEGADTEAEALVRALESMGVS